MKHMHILVPEQLYNELREKAFHAQLSISKVIVQKLQEPISTVQKLPVPESIQKDPLVPHKLEKPYAQGKDSNPF